MALNNGIISAPVAAKEVYDCLGVGKFNGTEYAIPYICENSHGQINQWSFNKSVIVNKKSALSDSDFYNINDGFTIPDYDYPSKVINAIFAGTGWTYNPPSSGDWKRITDFNGYNHNASPWFTFTNITGSSVELGKSVLFSVPVDIQWMLSNFIKWKTFLYNSQGVPYSGVLDIGILLRKTTDSTTSPNVLYYKICDYIDIDSSHPFHMTLPTGASAIPLGDYYVLPVITTDTNHVSGTVTIIGENSGDSGGTWYMIPSNALTITVKEEGSGIIDSMDFELNSFSLSNSGYFITIDSILLDFYNSYGSSVSLTVKFEMVDAVNPNLATYTNVYNITNGSSTLELIDPSNYPSGLTYESALGDATVRVTIQYGATTKSRSFQLY